MNDLSQRVHSGIGPPAGGRSRPSSRQLSEGVFEYFLYRSQSRLALPAMKVGAVVGKSELDVTHQRGSSNRRRPGPLLGRGSRYHLKQPFGDLHGVGGRSLAEVVADAPEKQRVGPVQVLADAADEHVVLAGGGGGQRIGQVQGIVDDRHARGSRPRARVLLRP